MSSGERGRDYGRQYGQSHPALKVLAAAAVVVGSAKMALDASDAYRAFRESIASFSYGVTTDGQETVDAIGDVSIDAAIILGGIAVGSRAYSQNNIIRRKEQKEEV